MTNGLTLVATLLLTLFYLLTYVFRKRVAALAAWGLLLLTFGMWLDHLHWLYVATTFLSAICVFWGALREPQ